MIADGGLRRRAVRRRLRIIEIVIRDHRRRGTHLRHLAGHCRARIESLRRIAFGIAHAGRLRGLRLRRTRGRLCGTRFHRSHAGTAGIGVETGIAVENEVIFVAARRISLKEHGTRFVERALADGLRGNGRCGSRLHGRRRIDGRGRRRIRRRGGRNGLAVESGAALGFGKVAERHGLLFFRGLFLAHPCRRKQHGAQRRCDEDEPEREQDEQRIEDIRPHRGQRGAHGIGDEPE